MTTGTSRQGRSSLSAQAVVPIGGAPFVPPLRTMMQHDAAYLNDEAPYRRTSGASDVTTDSNGTSSVLSSPASESVAEGSPSSSSSPSSPVSPTWHAAALRYSSAMQQHTRQMWENERLNIERARLGLLSTPTTTTNEQSRTNRSTASATSHHHGGNPVTATAAREDGLHKRNTISGGVDALFRGRRRHNKTTSVV